jgi:hypothetical protein
MAREPGTAAIEELTINEDDEESYKPHLVETEDEWIQEDE